MSRMSARWRSRFQVVANQWNTWRDEWQVERDLEKAVDGDGPILVGPWCSEVGYEVLYWIPFLRWVMAAYRVPESRIVAVSRGGVVAWYRGVAAKYVEIFDLITPADFAARSATGAVKQRDVSEFDTRLARAAIESESLPGSTRVLHPSLMFRWFAPFWSGHETLSFVERHTRYAKVDAPGLAAPVTLPREYAAVKFYRAQSLSDDPAVRAQVRAFINALSDRMPIVDLNTGLGLDDHADIAMDGNTQTLSLSGRLEPRTNLAVQTGIIAGARVFAGTCGSLAWLAPLLGVPSIPIYSDASFLHAHLHLARRVYGRVGAAGFSPVDISGPTDAGITFATAHAAVTSRRG